VLVCSLALRFMRLVLSLASYGTPWTFPRFFSLNLVALLLESETEEELLDAARRAAGAIDEVVAAVAVVDDEEEGWAWLALV